MACGYSRTILPGGADDGADPVQEPDMSEEAPGTCRGGLQDCRLVPSLQRMDNRRYPGETVIDKGEMTLVG